MRGDRVIGSASDLNLGDVFKIGRGRVHVVLERHVLPSGRIDFVTAGLTRSEKLQKRVLRVEADDTVWVYPEGIDYQEPTDED